MTMVRGDWTRGKENESGGGLLARRDLDVSISTLCDHYWSH